MGDIKNKGKLKRVWMEVAVAYFKCYPTILLYGLWENKKYVSEGILWLQKLNSGSLMQFRWTIYPRPCFGRHAFPCGENTLQFQITWPLVYFQCFSNSSIQKQIIWMHCWHLWRCRPTNIELQTWITLMYRSLHKQYPSVLCWQRVRRAERWSQPHEWLYVVLG